MVGNNMVDAIVFGEGKNEKTKFFFFKFCWAA